MPVSPFFRLLVDEEQLSDALFAFVADPSPARSERRVMQDLHDFAPEMVDVLEAMVLDGVNARHYVADYVHAVLNAPTTLDSR